MTNTETTEERTARLIGAALFNLEWTDHFIAAVHQKLNYEKGNRNVSAIADDMDGTAFELERAADHLRKTAEEMRECG